MSASKSEVASIMKLLDKDKKGYLDFKRFSDAMNPHMSEQVTIESKESYFPNLVPNRTKAREYENRSLNLRNHVSEVRKSF